MNNLASPDNNNSTYQDKENTGVVQTVSRKTCSFCSGTLVALCQFSWQLAVSVQPEQLSVLYGQWKSLVFLWLERKLETCFPRPTFSWFNRGTNSPDHACLWDVHRISDLCSRLRFLFFTAGFFFLDTTQNTTASLISQLLMNLPTMQETPVQFLG